MLQRLFPWFVNAYTDFPSAELYRNFVESLDMFSEGEWEEVKDNARCWDKVVSKHCTGRNMEHYRIQYNDFMAVRSDWADVLPDTDKVTAKRKPGAIKGCLFGLSRG